jgi:hypothetical protein
MRTVKSIFFLFVGVIFLVSCTVSNVNEKLIVGRWKNGQIKYFIANKKHANDTSFAAANNLRLGWDTANRKRDEQNSMKEFKESMKTGSTIKPIDFMALMKTSMDFNPDKSATIYTAQGKHGGTWKMNGKGDKVFVMDTTAKKKITINIARLDSNNLMIFERIPSGDLFFSFKR